MRVSVPVPGHGYDVVVGAGLLARAAEHLPELPAAERAFVVADKAVAERWFEPLAASLRERGLPPLLLTVPEGEAAKTIHVYASLLQQLATQEAHRDDVVVALGGGSVGDLAGFVAATYMRGVPIVQVPTTLTAQVDAAIGGKTAVNLPAGKNLVGAFHQPRAVIADVEVLSTLSDRDFRSGLAEVAKVGLTLDAELLARLETEPGPILSRDPGAMQDVVRQCAAAKAAAVASDERDTGTRLLLNYGHTLGHALERLESYEGVSHGEAITVGMVFAAKLAESRGLASGGLAARTSRLLTSLGLDAHGALPPADDILGAMRVDKKYRGGLRLVLLKDVDDPIVVSDVPEDEVRAVLVEMGAG